MPRSHKNRKKRTKIKKNRSYKLLAIPLIVVISIVIISMKNTQQINNSIDKTPIVEEIASVENIVANPTATEVIGETPEQKFDQLLSENKPIFAFFHSNNCQKCLDMIDVVNLVYPEFTEGVSLVDVNVYDPINQNLLKRANIQAIPTQYFIDSKGTLYQAIGLMTETELEDALVMIAGEQ